MISGPILYVIAGPNGAGKTTLYEMVIGPESKMPFINADVIQKEVLKDSDPAASYEAAKIAEEQRQHCLASGRSFVMETVFSHPSKLDFVKEAKALGYLIGVFHVGVESPDLSVARVSHRVSRGGHPVPEDKIRGRYARNGAIIRQAMLLASIGHVFDNSVEGRTPRKLLSFRDGREIARRPPLPAWVTDIYG